jgi:AraC-like DNA-binding protein
MEDKTHILIDNLLYSCISEKQRGNEQFVHEHALGCVIEGEIHRINSDGLKVDKAGTIALVRRNQLIKSVKVPPTVGEFKMVNIFISQDFLRGYATQHSIDPVEKYTGDNVHMLPSDAFLKGYFHSLLPYFDQPGNLSPTMAELKTTEAVELLLHLEPALKYFFFNFSEPHKINLEAYMNQHFMYNVPTIRFAQLTGRSLAGFKRDFVKIFNSSPGQWLQKKRLAEAYYLISEKRRKPSDVYLDVGFENLSHFSYSFKKTFGVPPSMV